MAKDKVFEIHVKGDGDAHRIYHLRAEDDVAAKELVREREAKQPDPFKITKTSEVE